MNRPALNRRNLIILALVCGGLMAWPTLGLAQSVAGNAQAVGATVLGTTTVLASTGNLTGSSDARQASAIAGSVPSVLSADSLHATAVGGPDEIASEASLGSLAMTLAGNTLSAAFVMARAFDVTGSGPAGQSSIDGLSVNGLAISVTGAANQTVPLVGGSLIINEQQIGSTGALVNALHLVISGVADVVIGSATAGTPPSSGSTLLNPGSGSSLPGLP